jgi:hypothetical protein
MASVADRLRHDTSTRVMRLRPLERIALALQLGDDDLGWFVKSSGRPRAEALAELRARRARGRVASRAARP